MSKISITRDVTLLAILAALLIIPSMFTRDLWNPDEPRYMAVGWGMVQTGDYLVPRLSGYVYPDKPPLFFWLAALFYRLGFGLNGGRVVAALASFGTVLVTYFLARRRIGERAGLVAATVTLTLAFFFAISKMGVIDPLVTFLMVSTIACGLRAMDRDTTSFRRWWLGAYALAGLSVLTKGPVGVAVPLVVLLAYGIAMRGKVRGGGWVHAAGALLTLNVFGWWLVPALVSGGGEYAREIVFTQTASRLVRSVSHQAPFYHYLMLLPGIMFPWSLVLIPAAWSAWQAWRHEKEPAAVLGLTWFLAVLLFFSIISGKRVGYILPLAPAVGLLVARYLVAAEDAGRFFRPRLYRALAGTTLILIAVGAALMVAVPILSSSVTGMYKWADSELQAEVTDLTRGLPLKLAFPMALMLALTLFSRRRAMERPVILAVALPAVMLIASLTMDTLLIPRGNYLKSGKNFGEAAKVDLAKADKVFLYKGDFSGVYNLYTGRVAIPIIHTKAKVPVGQRLQDVLAGPERVAVIGNESDLRKELGDPLPVGRVAHSVRVGHRAMLLVVNWPESEASAPLEPSHHD